MNMYLKFTPQITSIYTIVAKRTVYYTRRAISTPPPQSPSILYLLRKTEILKHLKDDSTKAFPFVAPNLSNSGWRLSN
jgi:hypothetical protein